MHAPAQLMTHECTFAPGEERRARWTGHSTPSMVGRFAAKCGVESLVLTHFSQRYGSLKPFLAEARELHDDVYAVRDGDRVSVPKRKKG